MYIFSTRNKEEAGRECIENWLENHGLEEQYRNVIELPKSKPIAKIYIDDRAWEFRGKFPDIKEIDCFVPWHGGKSSSQK